MKRILIILSILVFISVLSLLGVGRMKGNRQGTAGEVTVSIDADTGYADCANADIVIVPEAQLGVVREYAKQLVDDGKLLYIQDTARSKETLADTLSIPNDTRSVYNYMPHIATAVYQARGRYVFSYIYVQVDASIECVSNSQPFVATLEQMEGIQEMVSIEAGLASARTLYAEASRAPSLTHETEGMPAQADEIYADLVKMYDPKGSHLGDGLAVQYVYKRGRGIVNRQRMDLFDVITRFKAIPNAGKFLQSYQGRLCCDLEGQRLIDFAILPSGAEEASILQLGGGKLPGGAWWANTPDDQAVITNGAPSSGYVDYCASPGEARRGYAWELQPGIRVATSSEAGSRSAFSKLTIPALGILGQGGAYTLEVGGWF